MRDADACSNNGTRVLGRHVVPDVQLHRSFERRFFRTPTLTGLAARSRCSPGSLPLVAAQRARRTVKDPLLAAVQIVAPKFPMRARGIKPEVKLPRAPRRSRTLGSAEDASPSISSRLRAIVASLTRSIPRVAM